MYCHHCILFGRNIQKAWVKDGFSIWITALHSIKIHEVSDKHEASLKFKLQLSGLNILPKLEEQKYKEKSTNREIVRTLINVTLFLAQNCLSFRGHRENFTITKNRGNFLNLVQFISKYSHSLAIYISELQNSKKKPEVNFTSKLRQNQLISFIYFSIKCVIITELKSSKFFSISVDSTFDLFRKEQISFIVRYVSEKGNICERLIALQDSPITTGAQMFIIFKKICDDFGLDWLNYLFGQSYDGAQNMRDCYNGLQTLIKEKCPIATYIWCWANRLNLVVVKSTSCSINAVGLFGNLETLYNFISGSKKRVHFYENTGQKPCTVNTTLR